MWEVGQQKDCCLPFYLDLRGIPKELWQNNLAGLREECETFLGKDPQKVPIPTEPAVHYFMGGILVDEKHHTNKKFLYAAGNVPVSITARTVWEEILCLALCTAAASLRRQRFWK